MHNRIHFEYHSENISMSINKFIFQAAGFAIGVVGDNGVRANAIEPKMFVGMILILIFAEALGLYGLIIAIILSQ